MQSFTKNIQYYKFCSYGFLKNLRFFDAFFILFLVAKGMTFTQIGILYAVREISINVFEIPSGIAADTYGRTNSLIGSFFAYIVSFLVFYFSAGFWLFFLAFVLYGIGDAFRTGTHKGIIIDYLKINNWESQKISYYGHTRSWSQLGSAVSSLIAGFIVFVSGSYDKIFLYSTIPYVLNLILLFSYPPVLNRKAENNKHEKWNGFFSTTLSLFKVIRQPRVFRIVNTSAMHTAYLAVVKDYIQILMVSVAALMPVFIAQGEEKKNGIIVGIIYFFIYIATSFASKNASKIADKNRENVAVITLIAGFVFGLISGVFFYFEMWIVSLIAFLGIYLVENLRKPILTGFVSDNVPNEILTSVISAQSLLKSIITAVLAFFLGLFVDHFGMGMAFIFISGFLVISSVLIDFYRRRRFE
ncbi:MAG: MFS transporter [Draconibacterium sp.]